MAQRSLTSHASSSLHTLPGTYIYSVIRSSADALAAISSDDLVRLFSPTTLEPTASIAVPAGVTCVRRVDNNILATASRSGEVALWDTRTRAQAGTFRASAPVLSLDVQAERGAIAAGLEGERTAGVLLWDMKSGKGGAPMLRYTESHNDDVTELRFHPRQPLLLSGSTDALVNVYNFLTPPSGTPGNADDDVDGALRHVINHRSSVHKAGWVGDHEVWVASHDEMLGVYRPLDADAGEEPERKEFGDVRGPLGCEYVVDVLDRASGGGWVVSGSHSGQWLDMSPLVRGRDSIESWSLGGEGYRLSGAHGEEIVRGILMDEPVRNLWSCRCQCLETKLRENTNWRVHRRARYSRVARMGWSRHGSRQRRRPWL